MEEEKRNPLATPPRIVTFYTGEPYVNELADDCSSFAEYVMKGRLRGVDIRGIYSKKDFELYKAYAKLTRGK